MSVSNSGSKISGTKTPGEKIVTSNYINKSNIINEKSSDNDLENSNMNENEIDEQSNLYEREFRRFTLEYIKVLGIYHKEKKGEEVNINEIIEEFKIPREIVEEKIEEENDNNKEQFEISDDETKEDKIDFDNDIQPIPILNQK